MRRVHVPQGIGDSIWILQKLINSGEKFDFIIPDSHPQRGKQIFDLLPQVAASCQYLHGMTYRKIETLNMQAFHQYFWKIHDQEFCLSANKHLEFGRRIEQWFPDLETSFKFDWDTSGIKLHDIIKKFSGRIIGIYGSAYSTQRAWGFWDETGWMDLIKRIHAHNPNYVFAIIGAEWDLNLGTNLIDLLKKEKIKYINTIGESLGYVIELMKTLKYFFSFPSGLGILAPTIDCPVTMFYPQHLKPMINAWADPKKIESGIYKGALFCTPEEIFNWTIQNNFI